jgi:tungstate transport system substrate-binding protein
MRVAASLVLLALTLSTTASPLHAQQRILRIAVVNTPDVLLNDLIGIFERGTGYEVTLQVTEGVFDLARAGMADLVIAHYGHAGTEAFMAEGLGRWPRMVFANQAVLVGPSSDPAGIRGLTDAAEALGRIAQRGGEFLVNNAATEKYLAEVLWRTAGSPPKNRWQIDLQLRDQAAIEMAAQRGAYTVWGLVPFVRLQEQRAQQQRPLGMDVLVVGDPVFQRVMVSITVNPARIRGVNEEGALAFERFLMEPSTQASIRAFRHHGLTQQTWWPAGRNNAGAELSEF